MQSQNALPEISDSGDVPAESAVIPCQLEADEEASDDASEELESDASSVTVA